MRVEDLKNAFNKGVEEGKLEQEIEPTLSELWKLVAPQFSQSKFDVVYDKDIPMLTIAVKVNTALGGNVMAQMQRSAITVNVNHDGTFCVNHDYQNMGNSKSAESAMQALGRFAGKYAAKTL